MNYCFESNEWGDRFIPEFNRTRFEKQRASEIYDSTLEFDPCAENTLTFVVGSDSGLLFKYLQSKDIPEGSKIILLEPSEVFETIQQECQEWMSEQGSGDFSSNICLIDEADLQEQNGDNHASTWFLAGDVRQFQALCAISDYQNIYYPLYRKTRAELANKAHSSHNRYFIKRFIDQQMASCVDNHNPIYKNLEFGKGKVALIMGGGPSLDQHLDWIIENRSRLFILAVSRLCGKLTKLNLMPDLVVSVDPSPLTYSAAKLGTQWQQVPLVHSYHVAHMLPKQWLGPRYCLGFRYPWEWESTQSAASNIIESNGPTVGHAAVTVAFNLGFPTILLSGVDLCMDSEGSSHTQGTPEAELLKLPGNYDAQVTTYAGNRAGAPMDFYRSIEQMDHIGRKVNEHEDILFNLNEHAAAIASIKHKDRHEVKLPDSRPILDSSHFAEQTLEQLAELRRDLSQKKKEFRQIREVCRKAHRCIDQIYGKSGKPPKPEYHKRLDALESRLSKISASALAAIRYCMGPEYARLRKPSGFARMDNDDMENWARDYYGITIDGSRYYQKALSDADKLISLREAELAEEPDIEFLLQAWEEQNTPGRIRKFLDRLLETASPEQQARLQQASENFLNSLTEKDSSHDNNVLKNYESIRKTIKSLRYLHNQNCLLDLQSYGKKLKNLEWPYHTISTFTSGSVAELSGDNDKALDSYQSVIEDCAEKLSNGDETIHSIGALIEETLTRLTRLSLERQDGEGAVSTLSMLSEISPQYIPSYANLLDVLGNHESAVELLTLYLQNFKNDWRAAGQLARIHERAGNQEAQSLANQLVEQIRNSTLTSKKAA